MAPKPETILQTAIVKALRSMGVWVMVMNVTKRRGSRGVNCGEPGMPDLCLVAIPGLRDNSGASWIEVKLPGEDLSPVQVLWHAKANVHGLRVGTAWSVKDAVTLVQLWAKEHRSKADALSCDNGAALLR